MAKVALSKLNLKTDTSIKTFEWNDQLIEVKQYLPFNEKLLLISEIIAYSVDINNFKNDAKVDCFTLLGIIKNYTNLSMTEKQMEDPGKLYDLFVSTGFKDELFNIIPEEEYKIIYHYVDNIMDHIYTYKNSVYGVLDALKVEYSNMDLNASAIQEKLADPKNLEFLKTVLTKLG